MIGDSILEIQEDKIILNLNKCPEDSCSQHEVTFNTCQHCLKETAPSELTNIAGKTKIMPAKFYNLKKFDVTNNFINYCKPLIGKKFPQTTSII